MLEKAKFSCIETLFLNVNVTRMQDHRLPKIPLLGDLSSDHHKVGVSKKRYKDLLESPPSTNKLAETASDSDNLKLKNH